MDVREMTLPDVKSKLGGVLISSSFFVILSATVAGANTFSLGTDYSSKYQIAQPVYSPEPEISPELKEKCFKSCCIAKFLIKSDGKTSVKLLSSSGSPEVDDIALHALQQWKFRPAELDGKPVDSSRKIQVEFEVE
jgi:TonB family protein